MSTVVTLGPVGFKPTGAYDNTREYKKLDVVIYQGSCYIAKSDSIGQLPTNTTYWELLVQKGDTGNGITSIAKTGTSGLVDTYTITYTDETTSTFTVTNGEKGDPGEVTEEQLDEAMARANMVYNALPKVSDEGDSLTLDGTANCPMKMELKGNTEQTIYTGKNLFNKSTIVAGDITNDAPNIRLSSRQNLYLSAGTYTISTNLSSPFRYAVYVQNVGVPPLADYPTYILNSGWQTTLSYTFTINEGGYFVLALSKENNAGLTVSEITNNNFQLEQGSTATSYEPYVGGTPSPNPDYPQDVRVVTGNNSVKVIGKNLISKQITSTTKNGVTITNNGNGTYTLNGKATANVSFDLYVSDLNLPTGEYVLSGCPSGGSASTYKIAWNVGGATNNDFGNGSSYNGSVVNRSVWITIYNNYQCNNLIFKPMIEKGSTATTYEPYQSQTYPINLGNIELCKIGDYQDIIFHAINGDSFYDTLDNATKQTLTYGKWYKHSEIGKVVLDGSESWVLGQTLTNTMHYNISDFTTVATNIKIPTSETTGNIISNYFQEKGNLYNVDEIGIDLHANKNLIVGVYSSTAPTLTDFKDWLSTNNVSIYYVLATPTNEEITDTTLISQLNAIENSVSYDTQTNIVQENYSEPFIINAECVRSLKDIFELID